MDAFQRAQEAVEKSREMEKTSMPEFARTFAQIAIAEALIDIAESFREYHRRNRKGG